MLSISPPRFYARSVIVNANVQVPAFPLLSIQRAVALLKPGVLKKFECREKYRHASDPVRFACAVPVFGRGGERAELLGIAGLRAEQRDQ